MAFEKVAAMKVSIHYLCRYFAIFALLTTPTAAVGNDVVDEFTQRFPKDLPQIDAPSGAQAVWIARKMIRNGLPMSIRAFASNDSAEEITNHYLHEWKKNALSPMSEPLNEGRMRVGVLDGDYYISVETYPTMRGSEGYIIVTTDPANTKPVSKSELPLPKSIRIVNKDEYLDDGIVAETLTAVSNRSQRTESEEIARQLILDGWSIVNGAGGESSVDTKQLEFQKSAQQIQVTVVSDKSSQQTVMLLHWRKN